jgi:hypothetical protein
VIRGALVFPPKEATCCGKGEGLFSEMANAVVRELLPGSNEALARTASGPLLKARDSQPGSMETWSGVIIHTVMTAITYRVGVDAGFTLRRLYATI